MVTENAELDIMAIDCCEHMIAALETVTFSITSIQTRGKANPIERDSTIDLIVIGVSNYPVRRIFISQIRGAFPDVPMLILRRIEAKSRTEYITRGEFILSDQGHKQDLAIVSAVRSVLPMKQCAHAPTELNYNIVRDVMRLIYENYADPDLDLEKVAKAISISAVRLSRILNQQVGVSFRQLLRQTRIEEAKRMLASNRYIVKEVAVRVGFTDSHYFSRSFKAFTGQSASEYRATDAIFGE